MTPNDVTDEQLLTALRAACDWPVTSLDDCPDEYVQTMRLGLAAVLPEPADRPDDLVKLTRLAISDPGAFLPRGRDVRDGEVLYEPVTHWGARAVITAVLPAHETHVREQVSNELAAEGERVMAKGVEEVQGEGTAGFSTALRAATITWTSKFVRGAT
ncbi:hypothetical protein [Actinoallomurus sp. CA-142502]|uniref:hypothetical protein n=1 Tax=Actinoallomurus sp. CA-142502 TaxID=3239885 RepID=UPI003D8CCFA0